MKIINKTVPGKFELELPDKATALVLTEDGENFLNVSYHTNTSPDDPLPRSFCAAVGLGKLLETDLKLVEQKFKEVQDEHTKNNDNLG